MMASISSFTYYLFLILAPSAVNISMVSSQTKIFLSWSIPKHPNGILSHYLIQWEGPSNVLWKKNTSEQHLTINNLEPYTTYKVQV